VPETFETGISLLSDKPCQEEESKETKGPEPVGVDLKAVFEATKRRLSASEATEPTPALWEPLEAEPGARGSTPADSLMITRTAGSREATESSAGTVPVTPDHAPCVGTPWKAGSATILRRKQETTEEKASPEPCTKEEEAPASPVPAMEEEEDGLVAELRSRIEAEALDGDQERKAALATKVEKLKHTADSNSSRLTSLSPSPSKRNNPPPPPRPRGSPLSSVSSPRRGEDPLAKAAALVTRLDSLTIGVEEAKTKIEKASPTKVTSSPRGTASRNRVMAGLEARIAGEGLSNSLLVAKVVAANTGAPYEQLHKASSIVDKGSRSRSPSKQESSPNEKREAMESPPLTPPLDPTSEDAKWSREVFAMLSARPDGGVTLEELLAVHGGDAESVLGGIEALGEDRMVPPASWERFTSSMAESGGPEGLRLLLTRMENNAKKQQRLRKWGKSEGKSSSPSGSHMPHETLPSKPSTPVVPPGAYGGMDASMDASVIEAEAALREADGLINQSPATGKLHEESHAGGMYAGGELTAQEVSQCKVAFFLLDHRGESTIDPRELIEARDPGRLISGLMERAALATGARLEGPIDIGRWLEWSGDVKRMGGSEAIGSLLSALDVEGKPPCSQGLKGALQASPGKNLVPKLALASPLAIPDSKYQTDLPTSRSSMAPLNTYRSTSQQAEDPPSNPQQPTREDPALSSSSLPPPIVEPTPSITHPSSPGDDQPPPLLSEREAFNAKSVFEIISSKTGGTVTKKAVAEAVMDSGPIGREARDLLDELECDSSTGQVRMGHWVTFMMELKGEGIPLGSLLGSLLVPGLVRSAPENTKPNQISTHHQHRSTLADGEDVVLPPRLASVRASASSRSKSRQRSESIEPRGQEEASSSKEVKPIPGDEQMDNLVAAASIGDIVSLKALLKAKVNANGKAKGVSALYAATSNSHSGAVKLLTRYGALPDFASSPDPAAMHRSYQSLLSQPASRK